MVSIQFSPAQNEHLSKIQTIRERAFAPVFTSFRRILGDEIYDFAQRREDEAQAHTLASFFQTDSDWDVHIASFNDEVVGFVCIKLDDSLFIGEIGLNAIDPSWSGRGFGFEMYQYAQRCMQHAGMKVAVVSTGADSSHAAARRAYRKAGFDKEVPSVWMCRKL
jgi:GNAT superfamily N-acetyltransferase